MVGNWEDYRFMGKPIALKRSLKRWNREVFEDIRVKEHEVLSRISSINNLEEEGLIDESLKGERTSFKIEYAKLMEKESISWRQKSKVR